MGRWGPMPDDTTRRRVRRKLMDSVTQPEAYRRGQQARLAGRAIWANPHVGELARLWVAGWRHPLVTREELARQLRYGGAATSCGNG